MLGLITISTAILCIHDEWRLETTAILSLVRKLEGRGTESVVIMVNANFPYVCVQVMLSSLMGEV